jgi:predicted ATPase
LIFFKDIYIPMLRALCVAWAGRYAEGLVACERALQQWLGAGSGIVVPYIKAAVAESAVRCNRQDEAIELLDEALAQIEWPEGHERYALAEVLRVKALAVHEQGYASAAEALFQQALDTTRQQDAKSWELRTATSYARLLRDEGRAEEAISLLHPIYHWFTEGHNTRDLRAARALLEELTQVPINTTSVSAVAAGS